MSKFIQSTQGKRIEVDDWWYDYLNQFKWYVVKQPHTWYAYRWVGTDENGKRVRIAMHNEILPCPKGKEPDHIDLDGLNNKESNLRRVTRSENGFNRPGRGKTGYKGVTFHKRTNRFESMIRMKVDGVYQWKSLGYFDNAISAAHEFDKWARIHHGPTVRLNFPDDTNVYIKDPIFKKKPSKLGVTGVKFSNHHYQGVLQMNGQCVNLGFVETKEKAAMRYDMALLWFEGNLGYLNYPNEYYIPKPETT